MAFIPKSGGMNKTSALNRNTVSTDPALSGYTDETCYCRSCHGEFIFTAEQKMRLYVDYQAHTAARRVLCSVCKDDLDHINKVLSWFDEKLKPSGPAKPSGPISVAEITKMIELLKRKFKHTQKVDKSKMAQYKKILRLSTEANPTSKRTP